MSSTISRRRGRTAAAIVASALSLSALAISPAHAGPANTTPVGAGAVYVTSSTAVATGQKISFVGDGYDTSGSVMQLLSGKFDDKAYEGTAYDGSSDATFGKFQLQGDGTFSGSVVIPADIESANTSTTGNHWLRFLGSAPATSNFTSDFTVDNAAVAPTLNTSAAVTSSRGTSKVTLTLNGTGFKPNEVLSIEKTNDETVLGSITADDSGNVSAKTLTTTLGSTLRAGEWQIRANRADQDDAPAVSQVTVGALMALSNAALGSDGTVTVSNLQAGAVINKVTFDPDDNTATDNDVTVATTPITAGTDGVATGTITIPDVVTNLGTHTFTATQSYPYASSYTASSKISPSSATLNDDKYTVIKSADGAIVDGLYQTAYSAKNNVVYATAAYSVTGGYDGALYKLNAETLEVIAKVDAPAVPDSTSNYAPYGVGVDDVNGTVWVTNTRQNTVTVYKQSDLSELAVAVGTVTHTRDVVADPKNGYVFVSSASEGTTGNGGIAVYEADDKNDNGVKYELLQVVDTGARTEYSPMSLELDEASNTLFSPSLSSNKVLKLNTSTLEWDLLTIDGIMVSGRGASGVSYDPTGNKLFIASQNSDEVVVADATTGATLKETATGAGALNIAFDKVNRLNYVANFGGTTVTVLDADGTKVANLPLSKINHVHEDGKGSVFAVDKNSGNHVYKITPKKAETGTVTPTLTSATPTISGTAAYGKTLTARTGTWTTGTAFSYQWKRNGVAIAGATKASYAVVAADAGKTLTVTVTGTKASYKAVSKTSAGVKVASSAAVLKVAKAEAKVAASNAKITAIKAQIKAVKSSTLSKKAKAKKVKALNKKLSSAKKTLTKNKKALSKAKTALKKANKKK